ncbi:MAG: response regulator [Anaerolineales bacterium]|nr:response regulator [Anaerolineales bacterium]
MKNQAQTANAPDRSLVVLIIDDELLARETLFALLYPFGYQIEQAATGSEGLTKAFAIQPDVILLDVKMPEMDGYEVCRRIRADARLSDVPVIMISALDDRASRLAGLDVGADDFLSKPFDSTELEIRLRSITRFNRFRRLLSERRRFEWMVERAAEGYVIVDQHGLIQYANSTAQTFLNLPPNDRGREFAKTVTAYYRCVPEDAWRRWLETPTAPLSCYFVRPETPFSRAFWLQAESTDAELSPASGRVVSLRDVTAALSTFQDMREFQSAIMHKLRTPLVALCGSMEFLASGLVKVEPAEGALLIEDAHAGAERLRNEVEAIFRFVRAPTIAAPGDYLTVAHLCIQVSTIAAELDVALQIDYPHELADVKASLSGATIEMVFRELIENSYKHHPAHTPQVHVVFRGDEQGLRIEVIDDGVHLSPEQIAWALSPYIQGEKRFTGESPGMGLGLPMVASLLWQAGGNIRLRNREEQPGLVVDLLVPFAPPPDAYEAMLAEEVR